MVGQSRGLFILSMLFGIMLDIFHHSAMTIWFHVLLLTNLCVITFRILSPCILDVLFIVVASVSFFIAALCVILEDVVEHVTGGNVVVQKTKSLLGIGRKLSVVIMTTLWWVLYHAIILCTVLFAAIVVALSDARNWIEPKIGELIMHNGGGLGFWTMRYPPTCM